MLFKKSAVAMLSVALINLQLAPFHSAWAQEAGSAASVASDEMNVVGTDQRLELGLAKNDTAGELRSLSTATGDTSDGTARSASTEATIASTAIDSTVSNAINAETAADFSSSYSALTKKILLSSIELERFSLNYRLETGHQPKFRKLRYVLTQQAGAGCGLAFEITGVNEFGKGRKRPLQVNKRHLQNATNAAMTGSIIAGAGSAFELSVNMLHAIKNKRLGFDAKSANRYVAQKLHDIDQLLEQRAAVVQAHAGEPAYERAVLEGKVLHAMRQTFINEYSTFHASSRSLTTMQNLFYAMNISYNTVGAIAAGLANQGVTNPKKNGPANIAFIVSGALAMATPLLTTAGGYIERKRARSAVEHALHTKTNFNNEEFAGLCNQLKALPADNGAPLVASLPATQRFALYRESNDLFVKQLENETKTMSRLNKVALQASTTGPPIGSLLMSQGILGTYGYYKYTFRPRKQLNELYRGAILGTVGTSMALVGNTAWLLASWSYENKLKRKNQLPEQLIKERLKHLDELEKLVQTI